MYSESSGGGHPNASGMKPILTNEAADHLIRVWIVMVGTITVEPIKIVCVPAKNQNCLLRFKVLIFWVDVVLQPCELTRNLPTLSIATIAPKMSLNKQFNNIMVGMTRH